MLNVSRYFGLVICILKIAPNEPSSSSARSQGNNVCRTQLSGVFLALNLVRFKAFGAVIRRVSVDVCENDLFAPLLQSVEGGGGFM